MLQNGYPHIAQRIKNALVNYFVPNTEKKARAPENSYWYRAYKPNDPGIDGTDRVYYQTLTASTEEHLHEDVSTHPYTTVPTGCAYVSFGWYCDCDLGNGGYLQYKKQDVVKYEINARKVYQSKNPKHMYLDFDYVLFAQEQARIEFVIYNEHDSGNDQVGLVMPILFRIDSKSALNLEDVPTPI